MEQLRELLDSLVIGDVIVVETEHGGALGIVQRKGKGSITILTTEDEEIEINKGAVERIRYATSYMLEGCLGLGNRFFGDILREELLKLELEIAGTGGVSVVVQDNLLIVVDKAMRLRLLNGDCTLKSGVKLSTNLYGAIEILAGERGFSYNDLREIRSNIIVGSGTESEPEKENCSDYEKALERIASLEKEVEAYKTALMYALQNEKR